MTLMHAADATRRPVQSWGALVVVLCAIFMSTLDFFIVNVAIPSITVDLDASAGEIQWIVAGFALAVGAGVITAGRLGDLHGRRRLFALGLGAFTVASAACGLAPSAAGLVAFRVLQGASAAAMTPQVLAIIGTTYTGRARTTAFTAYGLTMGLAAVFGQLIGGVLVDADLFGLGWRSCFLINVPIGAAALAATSRVVPESRGAGRARLDVLGAALVTAALVALVLPLIEGREQGWPAWTWISFALSGALFAEFAGYQSRLARAGRAPLVDPAVFTDRAFSAGMLAQLVAWTGQASFFLVLAVYLQGGLGLSALQSGVLFTAIGSGYLVTSLASGAVVARLGRQTVTLGAAVMIAGLALLRLAAEHGGGPGWLLPGLIVDGSGMGLIIAPMASIVLARVAPRHAGAASGVLSTVMQIGGALGIALIGIIFFGSSTITSGFLASTDVLIAIAAAVMIVMQLVPRIGMEDS